MVRILIVDDHPLVADGIASMVAGTGYISICGLCKTAKDALQFLQQHQADVILLDINLPDMDGLQLCPIIRKSYKAVKIIALSSSSEASIIGQLLQRGGNGYLLKNVERDEFVEAIDRVMDGAVYLSKAASQAFLQQFKSVNEAIERTPVLTRREKEILQLLNTGLSGPQIADKLFLSQYTVETHRKNLLQKFSVNSTVMLLKCARDQRIL